MTQSDSYGSEQPYGDGGQYATDQYPAAQQPEPAAASKVNVPTILASAGVAAIVSAIVVTIGVVGLVIANDNTNSNNASSQTPTVVNLGAAAQTLAPQAQAQAPAAQPQPGAPAAPAAPAAEQVPESGGGTGSGTAGTTQGAAAPQAPAPTQQQTAAPAALNEGQLNTKIKTIMNTGASDAERASELQGGTRALGSINAVAQMLRVSGAGFSYQMVGPVKLNGNTLSANLQMSLVGNGSRYKQLSWVWMDNKWKLSNASVCDIAAYAMIPCSV